MENHLGKLKVTPKTGDEKFTIEGEPTGFDLRSFWSWSTSDLVSNTTRGVLAEFIVAQALGITAGTVRQEWDAYDLETVEGIKIEVKASAYIQSWHQERLSAISFDISKSRGWDPKTNKSSPESKRSADIYVFALHAHQDKSSVDPLNLDQWQFIVVPTEFLNHRLGEQATITLGSLNNLGFDPVSYPRLRIEFEHHL
ncbi:MAG: hypothetical protein ABFS17_11905 [Chloroflexota bacterium]